MIQKLGQLSREGCRGCVGKLACRIEGNAGLGSIGHNETSLRVFSQSQEGCMVNVWVDGSGDTSYLLHRVYGFAPKHSLKIDVVTTLLQHETLQRVTRTGLHDGYAIAQALGYPFHKSTKEVTLAKLNNIHGYGP